MTTFVGSDLINYTKRKKLVKLVSISTSKMGDTKRLPSRFPGIKDVSDLYGETPEARERLAAIRVREEQILF